MQFLWKQKKEVVIPDIFCESKGNLVNVSFFSSESILKHSTIFLRRPMRLERLYSCRIRSYIEESKLIIILDDKIGHIFSALKIWT